MERIIGKWREQESVPYQNRYASRFWQKIIYCEKDEKIGINVLEYPPFFEKQKVSYELDIQIPDTLSINGKTINITIFRYDDNDVNFKLFEKDALEVIDNLTKDHNENN